MHDEQRQSFEVKDRENLEKNLRLFVNGGFQGLIDIYYNYHTKQKIKYSNIIPFEDFINTNNLEEFYLNEVFFEVDNKYISNIGNDAKSLCNYYYNSNRNIENKKIDVLAVVDQLTQAINKSAFCNQADNPRLYSILKIIENFYSITYNNLYEDFAPLLIDRPQQQKSQSKTITTLDVLQPFSKAELKKILMLGYVNDFFNSETTLQEEGQYLKNNKWIKEKKELIIFCKVIMERGYIKPIISLKKVFNFFENRYNIKLGDQTKPSKHKDFITNEYDFTIFEKKK